MKSVFLYIVALLTRSECVLGDLEFYPDYKRSEVDVPEEEWLKEPQPSTELQRYLQEVSARYRQDRERSSYPYGGLRRGKTNKELDTSWPSIVARHIFNNKELALRLINKNERPNEPIRKQQYFKIMPSGRDPKARINRLFEDDEGGALLSLFKANLAEPNYKLRDTEGLDFSISDADEGIDENEQEAGEDEVEPHDHNHIGNDETDHIYEDESNNSLYDIDTAHDPSEFAYPPSDSRYFNEAEKTDADHIINNESTDDNTVGGNSYKNTDTYEEHTDNQQRPRVDTDVITKKSNPIDDDTAGMYIIAVVAGVSAAATVGFIAFSIGWYK